jgi:DNA-binding response OmpR family regulator
MSTANILLIESRRASAPSFAPALERKGYEVRVAHKVDGSLNGVSPIKPDLVILDAASMQTTGTRMCRSTRSILAGTPIILVAPRGTRPDAGCGANVTLIHPFTPRKLLNRVARLLPADERFALVTGPIRLNMAQRTVRSHGREARLTPKQAKLLEVFMHAPGQLMTREALIRQVWHTDYTGDTRTLDVHMSWLRRAIEPDPSHPRYIKTIRGMGYRLDLPTQV